MSSIKDFALELQSPTNKAQLEHYIASKSERDRFTAVVMRAVQEDPGLLAPDVNQKSLFFSCMRAAQDGLMPDKKEGVLVVYSTKNQKTNQWEKLVQWQPMVAGIRKLVAGFGFDIRAVIAYEGDHFRHIEGDDPRIEHEPCKPSDRGDIYCAYAIARGPNGLKYREVIYADELEKIRSFNKQPNSTAYKNWLTEMCKKAVAKRLYKSLPLNSKSIEEFFSRDNEQFDLEKPTPATTAAQKVQEAVRLQHQENPMDDLSNTVIDQERGSVPAGDGWPDEPPPIDEAPPREADF